ncbi:MAG: tetratricopeptide repeat protein [Caldilineaceae bacterium]
MTEQPTFGRWLKLRRSGMGLTQVQLGEQVGYAGETIRKVEADELRPSRQMAERLASVLDIAQDDRAAFIRFARDEGFENLVSLPEKKVNIPPAPSTLRAHVAPESDRLPHLSPPIPREPLIGRDWEITVVQNLLLRPNVGLVTLTGPGGVGKTRLALQIAANLYTHSRPGEGPLFPDGVYFVPLASLEDADLVLPAIAQMLEVSEAGRQPLLSLVQKHLQDKRLLIVLDNFEQIVNAGTMLSSLLQATPGLKLLVTSRTVLRLRQEHHFAVPPLALPDALAQTTQNPSASDLSQLMQSAAIRLFSDRAQAAQADFAVTSENIAAISAICQQLDGLPLAIELAAARIRLLPPSAMLARLGNQLKFLTGGAQDLPKRQQTMRTTLAWSYDLLTEVEKVLFRRIALFVGGCTLEAVETICNADGRLAEDTLEYLAALIDKSLLQQQINPSGAARFVSLRVIREYALEELRQHGEVEAIQQHYAAYFLQLAETAEIELNGNKQKEWLEQLSLEHDNLRAVLEWSITDGDAEMGLRLAAALWRFWQISGYYHEAYRWLAALLGRTNKRTTVRAKALHAAGHCIGIEGNYEMAQRYLEESLAIGRELNDPFCIALALHGLGNRALDQGDYETACVRFEESLHIRRATGDRAGMAASLNNLGIAAYEQGNYTASRQLHEESLALKRELGDQQGIASSLNNLGNLATNRGDFKTAHQLHEESLLLKRALGDQQGIATSLNNLGVVARNERDYHTAQLRLDESRTLHRAIGNKRGEALALYNLGDTARQAGDNSLSLRYYKESLRIRKDVGDKQGIAECFAGLADVLQVYQQSEQSVQLLAAASAILESIAGALEQAERANFEQAVTAMRTTLGEDRFTELWNAGCGLTIEQASALALA